MLAILGIFSKKEKFFAELDDKNTTVVEETVTEAVEKKVAKKTKKPAKKVVSKKGNTTTTKVVSKKAIYTVPFWVKAMENTRNYDPSGKGKSEMTFSTDYLLPKPTKYRRRPGGSLKSFLDMSRQINSRGL